MSNVKYPECGKPMFAEADGWWFCANNHRAIYLGREQAGGRSSEDTSSGAVAHPEAGPAPVSCVCPIQGGDPWRCARAAHRTDRIACECSCHHNRVGTPAPVSCVPTCPVREGLERISDRRMWHRLNGELTWRGQTADGNEIEVEDPRDIARMALAAPCLGPPAAPSEAGTRPKIVCLCGSTRFMEAFFDEGWRLTLEGKIVLSVGVAKHADVDGGHAGEVLGPNVCAALDELHLRKIDLADEVLVLNVGGYIGESTRREIAYAIAQKKPVRYLESLEAERGAPPPEAP